MTKKAFLYTTYTFFICGGFFCINWCIGSQANADVSLAPDSSSAQSIYNSSFYLNSFNAEIPYKYVDHSLQVPPFKLPTLSIYSTLAYHSSSFKITLIFLIALYFYPIISFYTSRKYATVCERAPPSCYFY